MEKTAKPPESDIATEPYKGPGRFVTGAGEGAIAHYGTMFAGLFGGGLLSGIFYKQIEKIEDSFSNFYTNHHNDSNALYRAVAKTAGWIQGAAKKLAEHVPGKEKLLARVPDERVRAVIFGGGILGFVGFFIAPVYFMLTGAKHSNDGRNQFRRAQDELLTTRTERDGLRDKYIETKLELEDLKTQQGAKDGTLRIAPDEQPVIRSEAKPTALLDSPTQPTAPRIEPYPTTGRTLPPNSAPPIQAPVIGPDMVQFENPTVIEAPRIEPMPTTGRTLPPNSTPTIQAPVIGPDSVQFENPTVIEAPRIEPMPTTGRTLPPNSAPTIQAPVIGPDMVQRDKPGQLWGDRVSAEAELLAEPARA